MSITFNNVTYATGFVGEDDGRPSTGFGVDAISTNPITVNGTVTKVGDPLTVTGLLPGGDDSGITATTNTLYVTQYDNSNPGQILLSNYNSATGPVPANGGFRFVLSNSMLTTNGRVNFTSDPALVNGTGTDAYVVPCFVSGTLIRTARGDVSVEDLAVGDLAVTASGAARPIVWIGQRTVDCVRHQRPNEVLPVRIAAHAFAENRPARDLVVSPGHSIAVDLLGEVLIPASSLINGTTIRQESVERVTYWHVELESHDLLVAENLPSESFLDMGNRGFLPRPGEAVVFHAVPDAARATHADFCRPFHAAGPVVDFVRDRLAARALQLDWIQVENPLADLHLVVDGRRVEAEVQGLSACFLVPATAETVWLASETAVPAMAGGGADPRMLGVCIGAIVIDDGFGSRMVLADDDRLCAGFHHIEEGPQRWTCGRARLPASLWESCRGSFFLRVELTRPALPRWISATKGVSKVDRIAIAS